MSDDKKWTSVRLLVSLDDELDKYLKKYPYLGNKSTFVANLLRKEMGL